MVFAAAFAAQASSSHPTKSITHPAHIREQVVEVVIRAWKKGGQKKGLHCYYCCRAQQNI